METKEILRRLREEHDLTQEAMAQRLHLSRQAVSRWETGETLPSVDTLQLISQVFSVSVDTLLGGGRSATVPVLRDAPAGSGNAQQRAGRHAEPGLLQMVLSRRAVRLRFHGHPDRFLRP